MLPIFQCTYEAARSHERHAPVLLHHPLALIYKRLRERLAPCPTYYRLAVGSYDLPDDNGDVTPCFGVAYVPDGSGKGGD